jgi:2-polyprenyl-6-methoxyphenol hydroxylase-like FAD-dependent oxidoreductase
MVGAYVLAEELAQAGSNYQAGLTAYENRMREVASRFRKIGPATMSTLIPRTRLQVRLTPPVLSLITRMPGPIQRRVSKLQTTPARALESIPLTGPAART